MSKKLVEKTTKSHSPWSWIPTLYFAEGIPNVVVMTVAVIMYKRLGISNTDIALYTGWLYLPWVIKPFWSPFVDLIKTKRWWIITMQLLLGAGLGAVAFFIPVPFFFQATLAVFWLIAFSSATHDIAADGFYMLALDGAQQSFFVGIRNTFFRLAMVTGQGLLIIFAGAMESFTGLEPVQFTVQSSETLQHEWVIPDLTEEVAQSSQHDFVVYPGTLMLHTHKISTDSLNSLKTFALGSNTENGFVQLNNIQAASAEVAVEKSWWNTYVSTPLGRFIKKHFGKNQEYLSTHQAVSGNAGLVAIRLSRKPEENKDVILNTSFSKGDKSISIISGERLTFTHDNWDKTAYIVVQLDSKLDKEAVAEFKGISGNLRFAWSVTFFVIAGMFICLFLYHQVFLPRPAADKPSDARNMSDILIGFGKTFTTFFQKKNVGIAIIFMLVYRLGEAMLVKMVSPFLLDGNELGGLGLTTGQLGLAYGTFGVVALLLGGIVGGIAASRKGLSYWLWPMALAITLPNIAYLLLAYFLPDNLLLIYVAVAVEQFGYGFGFTAYMLYLIYFADGEHKTAHYAICTGFMALGMMMPGMAAGWLQELLGYSHFFILIIITTIPTLLIIPFLKIDKQYGKK